MQYACAETNHAKSLIKIVGIDPSQDDPLVHPQNICHKCQNMIYVSHKQAEEGREYTPRVKFDGWVEHTKSGVCRWISMVQKGGARFPASQLLGIFS